MAISTDRTGSLLSSLAVLLRELSSRRRRQLAPVMALMLAGAVAELLTIGALIPFLGAIASPGDSAALRYAGPMLEILG